MFEFALHFRPDDPVQWIIIGVVIGALIGLFLFLWLRKSSVVDFLDPQTLKGPSGRAVDAVTETLAVSRQFARLAYAAIWAVFALLSGATAALILSSIALGAALGTGTRMEVVIGSLVGAGLALATWFFITALRDELRRDRTTRDRNGKGTT